MNPCQDNTKLNFTRAQLTVWFGLVRVRAGLRLRAGVRVKAGVRVEASVRTRVGVRDRSNVRVRALSGPGQG